MNARSDFQFFSINRMHNADKGLRDLRMCNTSDARHWSDNAHTKRWVWLLIGLKNEKSRIFNLPTTSRKAVCDFIGSVFIWHMYHPRSSSRTSRTCKNQALWSLCVTPILWFFVMTCVPIVRIVWVSTLNHAT